ncbi:Cytochrome oxidase biogenesis protein Sco1/SenC/PrrC, thiol-disulfide reductase involved in Cu(I) insertion into CoxII Cu(A) center, partial [hydrothermal vent metagenome]
MYGFKKKVYSAVAALLLAAPLLYTGCASSGDTASTSASTPATAPASTVEQGKPAAAQQEKAGSTESSTQKAEPEVAQAGVVKKKKKRKRRQRKSRYGENYFPNIELTNQDGKKFRFYDDLIKDKVVSINFIFTSCQNVCPLETARLKEVYNLLEDRIGKDLFMYSITVDPERDSPEVLKEYMNKFDIGPGWQFLTGKKEDIDALRVKLGLYIQDLDETLPDGQ